MKSEMDKLNAEFFGAFLAPAAKSRRRMPRLFPALALAGVLAGGGWLAHQYGFFSQYLRPQAAPPATVASLPLPESGKGAAGAVEATLPMVAPEIPTAALAASPAKLRTQIGGLPTNPGTSVAATAGQQQAPESPAAVAAMAKIQSLVKEKKYAEAEVQLKALLQTTRTEAHQARAHYLLGYIARGEKREAQARAHWERAANYARTRAGRTAALVLADTLFAGAVGGPSPKYSQWEKIRDLYGTALGMDGARFLGPAKARAIRNLTRLNEHLVFSPRGKLKSALYHTVRPGESLSRIAGKYGVEFDAIAVINRITPPRYVIRPGLKLKILKGKCTIVVDKSDLTVTWYLDGKWVKQYRCGIGAGDKTPAGRYTIRNKIVDPPWTNPRDGRTYEFGDPKNILGSRWLGLEDGVTSGLGLHGTTRPRTVPGRISNGCIRLLNRDVEELYGFARIHSTVIVRE